MNYYYNYFVAEKSLIKMFPYRKISLNCKFHSKIKKERALMKHAFLIIIMRF